MRRDEKYHSRERFLYALVFTHRRCYVGQSVATRRRFSEHQRVWHEAFTPVVLARMTGTYAEAEEHEYAWRLAAYRRGWRIYGAPGIVVNPTLRATPSRWALSKSCCWPMGVRAPQSKATWMRRLLIGGMCGLALLYGLTYGPLHPYLPTLLRLLETAAETFKRLFTD